MTVPPYPCDDGGEQLQEGGESFQLSLGDASEGWVAELCCVWVWKVSPQVLMVEHQGVKKVFPRHRAAGHSLEIVTCVHEHEVRLVGYVLH